MTRTANQPSQPSQPRQPRQTGRPRRPRGRRTLPAAVLSGLTTAVVLLGGLPADATRVPTTPAPDPAASSADLTEEVEKLTGQVEELEVAAAVAAEAWNETRAELDALAVAEVDAQTGLDDAGRALEADQGAATRRVRALYRSGGTVELAWTAFAGSGLAQAATTYRTARSVLDSDAAAVLRAREQVDVAVESSAQVQQLRRDRAELEELADVRKDSADAALQAREDLLAGTDAALVAAVERERQEAERAAVAWALAQAEQRAQEAAAAAVALPGPGTATGSGSVSTGSVGSATVGPAGGTVPAGFVGPDLDEQEVVDRAAAAAPTQAAADAIRAAATRLGSPYVWGATGPGTFDCSGLTMWAYRQAGVNIPRTSRQQFAGLPQTPAATLLPGDLVFYANGSSPSSIHHVSIYLGDGLILTAPRAGDVVKISAVWQKPIYGAVRPTG